MNMIHQIGRIRLLGLWPCAWRPGCARGRDSVEIGAGSERRHRLECECRRSRARGVLARRPRAAGGTHVRDDARGDPRRAERHRPALAPLRREPDLRRPGRRRRPRWRRPRATSWSRCSARSPSSFPRLASTRASPAWKRTTWPRSRRSRTGRRRLGGVALGQAAAAAILALRSDDGFDTPLGRSELPGGHRARRVPLHTRHALRVRSAPGRGPHAVRARGRLAVPPGPAVLADQPQVRRGRQRGAAPRRRRRHHSQRPHGRADRDRPVLGRELAARVEPDRPDGRDGRGARPLGERAAVRPAQHGHGGRLHRHASRPSTTTASGARSPRSGSRTSTATRRRPPTRRGRRCCRTRRSRTTTPGTPSKEEPRRRS